MLEKYVKSFSQKYNMFLKSLIYTKKASEIKMKHVNNDSRKDIKLT